MIVQAMPVKDRTDPKKPDSQAQGTVKEEFLSILKEKADSGGKISRDQKDPVKKTEKKEDSAKKGKLSADNGEQSSQAGQINQADQLDTAEQTANEKEGMEAEAADQKKDPASAAEGSGEVSEPFFAVEELLYQSSVIDVSARTAEDVMIQKNSSLSVQEIINGAATQPELNNRTADGPAESVFTEAEKTAAEPYFTVNAGEQETKSLNHTQANHQQTAEKAQAEVLSFAKAGAQGGSAEEGMENSGKENSDQAKWFSLDQPSRGEHFSESSRTVVKQGKSEEMFSLDELQKKAEQSAFLPFERLVGAKLSGGSITPVMSNKGVTDAAPLPEQLRTGIEQGLSRQLNQFTIRLKPEGLGEVLVHMTSTGGKIALSIGVSSLETQKLLSSEMMHLKETMQPLNAEVQEIYHNSQGGMEMMNYGQGFYQNQQRDSSGKIHRYMARPDEEVEEEDSVEMPEAAGRYAGYGRLSAYI